jgi:hypothetical protein
VVYVHGLFELSCAEGVEKYGLSSVLWLLVRPGAEIGSLKKSCLLDADNREIGGRLVRMSYQKLL